MLTPYRIKITEKIISTTRKQRAAVLASAGYNPFQIPADKVLIDLISDSGTGAMSSQQWASMIQAREDFSGQKASADLVKTIRRIFGFRYVQPVHQGRAAENILFKLKVKSGDIVAANTHFETTRANIESLGGKAIDLPDLKLPFSGNINIPRLEKQIKKEKPVMIIMTITNNINGGQPVSIKNLEQVKNRCQKSKIPVIIDASRFAGNAFLNKEYLGLKIGILNVVKIMFKFCDIAYLSGKKDCLCNVGGIIMGHDQKLFEQITEQIIQQESYPSSGGMAARDIAALNIGVQEAIEEDFLRNHINSIRLMASYLKKNQVEIFEPVGAHGVVIIPKSTFKNSGFSLAAEVFLQSGVRGGVFDDLYRLAIPRRVYTQDQLKFAADEIGRIYHQPLPRLKMINKPVGFTNFFARFKII